MKDLGRRATYRPIKDADHSFGVPVRSGRSHEEVLAEIAELVDKWIARIKSEEAAR